MKHKDSKEYLSRRPIFTIVYWGLAFTVIFLVGYLRGHSWWNGAIGVFAGVLVQLLLFKCIYRKRCDKKSDKDDIQ